MSDRKRTVLIINIALFAIFIASIVFVTVKYTPFIMKMISDPDKFRDMLLSYGTKSIFVYIFFQILHVIIVVIPGEIIQIAGGYVFGIFLGSVYSLIGILIGMVIVFFTTRLFGLKVIKALIPQKSLGKFTFLINSEKSEIAMFVFFLIPGIPKDALCFIAGVTPIKPLRFLIIAGTARIPGLVGSCIIGASLQQNNYFVVIALSAVACILFIAGILLRDKIINKLHRATKATND